MKNVGFFSVYNVNMYIHCCLIFYGSIIQKEYEPLEAKNRLDAIKIAEDLVARNVPQRYNKRFIYVFILTTRQKR